MKIAKVKLKSASPYSQSRFHNEPKLDKEHSSDYEKRTWRKRLHTDSKGRVFIPPMQLKNSLAEAAKYMAISIPGKGKATWTKHFAAGILVVDPLILPDKAEKIQGETFMMDAQGRKGSNGTRVPRTYPVIPEWEGTIDYHVIDETITQEVFKYHIEQAGLLIGIGRFRPRNGGFYGRYTVEKIDWK